MVIAINKLLMQRAIFCCPFLFLRVTVDVLSVTRKKYSISVFFSEWNVNFDHLVHFFVDHLSVLHSSTSASVFSARFVDLFGVKITCYASVA
ncbi:TPA: hypothetical protein MIR59_18485 [Klebsiella pneumoniae]|nr:hypothetical protein [Klebsiella pneumoniae]HBY0551624.1 hypothetical protein [Klebsiella pneumoniae subsp. pneumoniae]KAB7972124.1 hypothetical protein GCL04_00035 [Klebsiella pneumoniae]PXJ35384.1 hypothetical protein DMR26_17170 [Klebsiella pneumoniae]QFU55927.1 hypothetical protein EP126_17200 [Klebsiella pneumoniae]